MDEERATIGRPYNRIGKQTVQNGAFSSDLYVIFVCRFYLDLRADFPLFFAHKLHLDFVGATSGRPPKNESIPRITDLSARLTVRKPPLCKGRWRACLTIRPLVSGTIVRRHNIC